MSPSFATLRLERRRTPGIGRRAVVGFAVALGGVFSGTGVATAALTAPSLPAPVVPSVPVPGIPTIPGVPAIPGVPSVPGVPGGTEAPSLTTLEQLLASKEAGSGPGGGPTYTLSGGGSGSSSPGAAPGSGFVLSASSVAVRAFKVLSVRITKSGQIVDTVALPEPAGLVVKASGRPHGPKHPAHATRRGNRSGARLALLASFSMHAPAGIAVIVLNPKLLKPGTKLVVATTYAPHGAVARTITRSVAVPRVSSSRRKH